MCVKGRFGLQFVGSPDRLTHPLIRRDGELEEATWDEALDVVAQRLADIREEHGADAIAGFSSAKCTNEENYVFQKFMRAAVGTNNVDHCARLCHSSTVAGLAASFGSGAMTNSMGELEHADCILVTGSNTTEAHPVIGFRIKSAVTSHGCRLIVADPRRIDLVRFAEMHLQQRCGSDVLLFNALMHVIIEEELYDKAFVEERTEGFEELCETVAPCTPEVAELTSGVPADDIRRAARAFAGAERAAIVYSMGITQHTTGTDNVKALANLAMLTGNVGFESTGVNPLRGQNNVQGACDLGALPNVFPGYQKVAESDVREKFAKAWDRPIPEQPGLTIVEVLNAVDDGHVHALYVMGENPVLSDPNSNHTRRALAALDFLVVQDIFLTETAEYADVVLPAASFAEKDGTFTNTERRVQRLRKALDPPGEARVDWEILCDLATRMGVPMSYPDAGAIMDEIASVTPIYGGMAYDRLDGAGLQWPCPDREHPGTPYLHKDKFARGLGKFHATPFREAAELPDDEYPFLLSTGRVLYHFHTATMTRQSDGLNELYPGGDIQISAADAERLGLEHGDRVDVASRRGQVTAIAMVTDRVPEGMVYMPFHFREASANVLTNDALDPVAKIPELKVCAVRLARAQ
jgi:formate dehydrogenase alpha subunit